MSESIARVNGTVVGVDEANISPSATAASGGTDVYEVTGPDCANKPAKIQQVTFRVDTNRQITGLWQECIAGPCGWSYHRDPNPPGREYDIDFQIQEGGTKAVWWRKHTSSPVTYRVHVEWKTL